MDIVEDQAIHSELSLRDFRVSYTSYYLPGIDLNQEHKGSNYQFHGIELQPLQYIDPVCKIHVVEDQTIDKTGLQRNADGLVSIIQS